MAFVFLLLCGAITAAVAQSKGRNPLGWFLIGFFFHIFGLILVAVVSSPAALKEWQVRERTERNLLREQLRQERMKSAAFQEHARRRLDTHDDALGLDTRAEATFGSAAPAGYLETGAPDDEEAILVAVDPPSSAEPEPEPASWDEQDPMPAEVHAPGGEVAAAPDAGIEPEAGRAPEAELELQAEAEPAAAPPQPPAARNGERKWFYEEDGEARGPAPESVVFRMLTTGGAPRS